MNNIIYNFALSELERLQTKANDTKKVKLEINPVMGTDVYQLNINSNDGLIESGNNRGLLYGVYTYAKEYLGYDFSKIGSEEIGQSKVSGNDLHKPRIDRRGNIFEVINDTDYLKKQIDLNGKNGHNEMFFTFFLFDEVKDALSQDLEKRGINVTLGGHSLKWLLEPILELSKNEDDNLGFYKNEELMKYAIKRIIEICKENPIVGRISLWPQDIGIPQSRGKEFMQLYIDFNKALKDALDAENLNISVEFIVYNAGLNWEMLDYYEGLTLYSDLDILYAYWGRDYSQDFTEQRPIEALKSWLEVGNVTVLEYYSDFFMQSELYPPLENRISKDITMYEKLGVDGVLNLVVPLLNSRTSDRYMANYDYKNYHQNNNNVYSQCLWEVRDYPLSLIEKELSSISRYNRSLFPKRFVDVELNEEMIAELESIKHKLSLNDPHQNMLNQVITELLYDKK